MKTKRLSATSAKKCMVIVAAGISISLLSCATQPGNGTLSSARAGTASKGEKVEPAPQPGDVKIVDGTEYIYTRNVRFMTTPYEPEYMWVRKADYVPGAVNTLKGTKVEKDELAPLKKRIEMLEEELRKQSGATAAGTTK